MSTFRRGPAWPWPSSGTTQPMQTRARQRRTPWIRLMRQSYRAARPPASRGVGGRSQLEGTLEPRHVPERVELAAHRAEGPDRLEPEPLVQADRRRVRQADAGDDAVDVLVADRVEQRSIQRAAASASDG